MGLANCGQFLPGVFIFVLWLGTEGSNESRVALYKSSDLSIGDFPLSSPTCGHNM